MNFNLSQAMISHWKILKDVLVHQNFTFQGKRDVYLKSFVSYYGSGGM
jgi:hypothetical protein